MTHDGRQSPYVYLKNKKQLTQITHGGVVEYQTGVVGRRVVSLAVEPVYLPVPRHLALVGVRPAADVAAKVAVCQRPVLELDVLAELQDVGEHLETDAADEGHRVRVHAHHVLPVVDAAAPELAADLAGVGRAALELVVLGVLVAEVLGREDLAAVVALALRIVFQSRYG